MSAEKSPVRAPDGSPSSSNKDLQKLQDKLQKAEEKMKKAEEKMKLAKEKFEKARTLAQAQAQAQAIAFNQASEGSADSRTKEKKEKKEKKRKREAAEQDEEQQRHSVRAAEVPTDQPSQSKSPLAPPAESEMEEDSSGKEKEAKRLKKEKKEKKEKKRSKVEGEYKAISHSIEGGDVGAKEIFGDEKLSDQAKKHVYYAYLFSNRPNTSTSVSAEGPSITWKFNKAKQNWLIRNVFSNEEIPEKYLEIVLSYLKTTQGSSRINLMESAKKIINPPTPISTGTEEDVADLSKPENDGVSQEAESQAQTQSLDDTESKEDALSGTQEGDESANLKLRKERAERLLSSMDAATNQ
ncbi:uncharacterized protein I303_105379 [Kwoniella dejecticola CBS 10117]|uniref:WKF domain-containing protein n=1 Tax=Kwoniella dejecticola CBS 10117 TaxID=1296121 RepID=A0A1A6A2N1_9TREE|nr:uncharacterized protein I303_05176 [Kwoniella dejecticola CBS 10117]OBR84318.1 hypothetical protein I303_05176 [Kwoniella dejecticola CBS 10117]